MNEQYSRCSRNMCGERMRGMEQPWRRCSRRRVALEISYNNSGRLEPVGELVGQDAIAAAVSQMMQPHPAHGWSHHTTHDHIIEVDGDNATIDAQFVVFEVRGKERPTTGWPEGAFGAQGTVEPTEAGYYRPILRRVDGDWKIETLRIVHNLPMAFPGQ